jgi:hypothetical protein
MPLAVLTFLTSLAYVPDLPSASYVGRWVVMAVGASVLVWSVRARMTPGHWMGLGFLTWCFLGLYWTVSPLDTLGELWHWCVAGALFLIAAEQDDLSPVIKALALGVTVSTIVTLAHTVGLYRMPQLGNFAGLWSFRNTTVEMTAVALVGAAGLRFWWGVPGPLLGLYLAGSGTREGILMILAAVVAWAWVTADLKGRLVQATVVLFWLAVAWWGDYASGLFKIWDRLEIWGFALSHLHVLGWGLNTFGALRPDYEFAHNEVIQYLFELGVGVTFMIGVVLYALSAARTLERVMLLALGASALVWFPLHVPGTVLVGVVLAGFLCGARHRAIRLERVGRDGVHSGRHDPEPHYVGAPTEFDVLGRDLSAGPQPAPGSGAVPRSL